MKYTIPALTLLALAVAACDHPMPVEAAGRNWSAIEGTPCVSPAGERRFSRSGTPLCPGDRGYETAQAPKQGRRFSASGVPLYPGDHGYGSAFRVR